MFRFFMLGSCREKILIGPSFKTIMKKSPTDPVRRGNSNFLARFLIVPVLTIRVPVYKGMVTQRKTPFK